MTKDLPQNLWPHWQTHALLGQGGFGAVYEIRRDILGEVDRAALKVIRVPHQSGEIDYLRSGGYDEKSIADLLEERMQGIVKEYKLMSQLKGHANVVYCDDFQCVPLKGQPGWEIYIKMELLNPILKLPAAHFDSNEVIRLGIDMCRALELCQQYNIIHRDIKPQNIFLARDGNYKLGDFGIAKSLDSTAVGTVAGTFHYIAPEVYNNQAYGAAVDIYSLGLVLYWLLNERRAPFLPLPPKVPRQLDMEEAMAKRLIGSPLPLPAHGSAELKKIVQKACAFCPRDRFASPQEMRQALEALTQESSEKIHIHTDSEITMEKPGERYVSYLEQVTGSSKIQHYDSKGSYLGHILRGTWPGAPVSIHMDGWGLVSFFDDETTIIPGIYREITDHTDGAKEAGRLIFQGLQNPCFQLKYGGRSMDISAKVQNGQSVYTFAENGKTIMEISGDVTGLRPRLDSYGTEIYPQYVTTIFAPVPEELRSVMMAFPWLCFTKVDADEESEKTIPSGNQQRIQQGDYPRTYSGCRQQWDSSVSSVFRDSRNREICTVSHTGGERFAVHINSGGHHVWGRAPADRIQITMEFGTWYATYDTQGFSDNPLRRDIFDNSGEQVAYLEFFSLEEPCQRLVFLDQTIEIETFATARGERCRFIRDGKVLMEMDLVNDRMLYASGPVDVQATVTQPLAHHELALMLAFQDLQFSKMDAQFHFRWAQQQKQTTQKLVEKIRASQNMQFVPVLQCKGKPFAFVTCLSMIYASKGREIPPAQFRRELPRFQKELRGKSRFNAVMEQLQDKFDAITQYKELTPETELETLTLPLILCAWDHPSRPPFAVLQGFQGGMVHLVDPISGPFTLPPEAFLEQYWKEALWVELMPKLDNSLFQNEDDNLLDKAFDFQDEEDELLRKAFDFQDDQLDLSIFQGEEMRGKEDDIPGTILLQEETDFAIFQGCPPEKIYAFYLSRIMESLGLNYSWMELSKGCAAYTREDFDKAARAHGLSWQTRQVSRKELLQGSAVGLMGQAQVELLFERDQDNKIWLWDPREGRVELAPEAIALVSAMHLRIFTRNQKKNEGRKRGFWPFRR